LTLDDFDRLSKDTPHITSLRPGGEYFMEDLEYAGGIPAVLKRLSHKLNNMPTLSGKNIVQIAAEAQVFNDDVLRPVDNPYHAKAGYSYLKAISRPKALW
jgi:dihydroxy-acid dehydratase